MIINRGTKDSIGGLTLPEFMKGEELIKELAELRCLSGKPSLRRGYLEDYMCEALKDFTGTGVDDPDSIPIFAANARAIKLTSPLPHLRSIV